MALFLSEHSDLIYKFERRLEIGKRVLFAQMMAVDNLPIFGFTVKLINPPCKLFTGQRRYIASAGDTGSLTQFCVDHNSILLVAIGSMLVVLGVISNWQQVIDIVEI